MVKLGIAPIAWTNDDMPDLGAENTFEQCISEMALSGFSGCEIGSKFPKNVDVLNEALKLRGLRVASAWFSSFLTTGNYEDNEKRFDEFTSFLKKLGADRVNVSEQGHSIQGMRDVSVIGNKPYFSEKEWRDLCDGLNKFGSIANKKGMKLCYHHHMGTGVQTLDEIDRLMENTDSDKVFLVYDTGHLFFSGIDPRIVLDKYGERIAHVHLKDVRAEILKEVKAENLSFLAAVRKGVFTVPGDGAIDFIPLFEKLKAQNYDGWFIVEAEQDPAKANPFKYALKARKYIKNNLKI